jgi:hypothetical protein
MKRFTFISLCVFALLFAGFIGFNLLIDPYDVTRLASIERVNAHKTRAFMDGSRVYTADRLLHGRYRTVLLGNSRVHEGFLTESTPWPGVTLNAGLASSTAFELGRAAVLAGRARDTACIVIALELEDFDVATVKGAYWVSALPDANGALSLFRQAASTKTFTRSVQTIGDNSAGRAYADSPWRAIYKPGEQRARFVTTARDAYRRFRDFTYDPERTLYLAAVIDHLTRRGIQVIAFFSPTHAWREEALFRAGRADDYFRFRNDMLAALWPSAQRAARAPCVKAPALALWDFAGFQPISQIEPPDAAAIYPDPFFYEASHFTPRVGAAVLRRMTSAPTENGLLTPDQFGMRLDPSTLDKDEAAIRARRAAFLQTQAGREITALIDGWAKTDRGGGEGRRYYITRQDWRALDQDLPPSRP